jgi:hypothetical protein
MRVRTTLVKGGDTLRLPPWCSWYGRKVDGGHDGDFHGYLAPKHRSLQLYSALYL